MAAFDSSLMLYNTTTDVDAGDGVGGAEFTGSWVTLGTGIQMDGLPIRIAVQTSSGSNTDTMAIYIEMSDDQSLMSETVHLQLTGTELGSGTTGGALVEKEGDRFVKINARRAYIRARIRAGGTQASFGDVTIGVDGGDFNAQR